MMSQFKERYTQIEKSRKDRIDGKFNFIPFFDTFPRLSTNVPGIFKGMPYIVTSSSGVGKTTLTKELFVNIPIQFARKTGLKLKIIYFCLEESKDEFIDKLIVTHLKEKYNISIDFMSLRSYSEDLISEDVLLKIKASEKDIEETLKYIDIVDTISNPTGMYKYCKEVSNRYGTHLTKEVEINGKKREIYDRYVVDDDDTHFIVIADHISLLTPETHSGKMLNQHQTMSKWSRDYSMGQITKHWNWTSIIVQQQSAEKEKVQYTSSGRGIYSKLEPSADGLADNKTTFRDCKIMLGLFEPYRYGIPSYQGYDIEKWKDSFRSLSILKNRFSRSYGKVALKFDGKSGKFLELPLLIKNY